MGTCTRGNFVNVNVAPAVAIDIFLWGGHPARPLTALLLTVCPTRVYLHNCAAAHRLPHKSVFT